MPIVENCNEGKVVSEDGDHPLTNQLRSLATSPTKFLSENHPGPEGGRIILIERNEYIHIFIEKGWLSITQYA